MNKRSICMALAAALAAGWVHAADAPPATTQPAQAALFQTCFGVAADFSPVYPTSTFPVANKEATVVFRFATGEHFDTLVCTWSEVKASGLATTTRGLAVFNLAMPAAGDRGWFRYAPPGGLPVGSCRVEVTADGKPWQAADFTVVAGRHTTITIPGVTPDAAGVLKGDLVFRTTDLDPAGARLELAIAGQTIGQPLDPPRMVLPWSIKPPMERTYQSKDGSAGETCRLWGPVPVKGPAEEAPGFVVMV